jgi:hypothetical protein
MKKSIVLILLVFVVNTIFALNDSLSVKEKEVISQAELDNKTILIFKDAETNEAIADLNVTLRIKKNTRETVQAEFKTNEKGIVSFDMGILEGIENSSMYVIAEKEGYIKYLDSVNIMIGTVYRNSFALTKDLPLGKMRFVLTWSNSPTDLDLHLVGKNLRNGDFHISFRDKKHIPNLAKLDRDDRDGYGPETITLDKVNDIGNYQLFVRNYSRDDNIKSSAVIHIYANNKLTKIIRLKATNKRDLEIMKINDQEIEYTNREL